MDLKSAEILFRTIELMVETEERGDIVAEELEREYGIDRGFSCHFINKASVIFDNIINKFAQSGIKRMEVIKSGEEGK
jgi:hypothetical protein